MPRPRILVTGGAGYIGSHACKLLSARGFEPVTLDDLSTGHRDAVRFGPFVKADIGDRRAVAAALARYRPEAVMHFAACASVAESVADPVKYERINVGGTRTLLEACRHAGIRRFIFSSSCATYGVPSHLPIRESTPQQPINPYGSSKLMGERLLRSFEKSAGLSSVSLRYFNACGADPDGELAERHEPETHLIPNVLKAASGERADVEIYGDDYDTPDGTCIRDYIHVRDLAQAHLLALSHLLDGGGSLALNVGAGEGRSIREIVTQVERVTGRSVPQVVRARRAGDPPALYADASRIRERLGFTPRFSDLQTVIETAAPHFGLDLRRRALALA